MSFTLPPLPYAMDALKPHMSEETLQYHYGKHHQTYVTNLNNLVPGTKYEKMTLDEIVLSSDGKIFNNAAQIWNHTFFWNGLSPKGGGEPKGELGKAIARDFGSFQQFKEKFSAEAVGLFGSAWAWLVKKQDGTLAIEGTSNAGNPMTKGALPLWTVDVWEHAYYIDYRNARAKFVEGIWALVNWDFVEQNFAKK